jgi:hypothetical protein
LTLCPCNKWTYFSHPSLSHMVFINLWQLWKIIRFLRNFDELYLIVITPPPLNINDMRQTIFAINTRLLDWLALACVGFRFFALVLIKMVYFNFFCWKEPCLFVKRQLVWFLEIVSMNNGFLLGELATIFRQQFFLDVWEKNL